MMTGPTVRPLQAWKIAFELFRYVQSSRSTPWAWSATQINVRFHDFLSTSRAVRQSTPVAICKKTEDDEDAGRVEAGGGDHVDDERPIGAEVAAGFDSIKADGAAHGKHGIRDRNSPQMPASIRQGLQESASDGGAIPLLLDVPPIGSPLAQTEESIQSSSCRQSGRLGAHLDCRRRLCNLPLRSRYPNALKEKAPRRALGST